MVNVAEELSHKTDSGLDQYVILFYFGFVYFISQTAEKAEISGDSQNIQVKVGNYLNQRHTLFQSPLTTFWVSGTKYPLVEG